MASKNIDQISKGEALHRPYFHRGARRKLSRGEGLEPTCVRPPDKIPSNVLAYFKMDPRTQREYKPEEKTFYAQVLLHEIEEGLHLLQRLGMREDADRIGNFSNAMHVTQRLELLRHLLSQAESEPAEPERVRSSLKARNNQCSAAKCNLGNHQAVAVTEVGIDYKPRNEDGFLMMPEQKVLALADGMGGHVAGHIASGIAIDFFQAGIEDGMDLETAICFANEAIMTRSHNDPRLSGMHPMGCTFAAVQIRHTLLRVAHVGDTKILVIRDGKILFESRDHTQGQELLREGLIDSATALELNHILNRCIGLDSMRPSRDVEVSTMTLAPGDRVLLATDGVTDNFFDRSLSLEELSRIACSAGLPQAAEMIVDESQKRMRNGNLPDGRTAKCDNLSLALMEFRG